MNDPPADHECDRPAAATGGGSPWRCPACGQVWELLPAAPAELIKRARRITSGTAVPAIVIALALAVGGVITLAPELLAYDGVVMVIVGLLVLGIAAAFWQHKMWPGQWLGLPEEERWRRRPVDDQEADSEQS
ncbi:hypothetical protein [Nonomuraea typhae]|uniref:DUF983 domain-containing protein n=1 Tax=Nonomuraea typhae TaxID=2603600 RepID=A0ABW7Z992_9ACTN